MFLDIGRATQFTRMLRKTLEDKNNEINTLLQKTENLQKDFKAFLDSQPTPQGMPVGESGETQTPVEIVADANVPTESV